MQRPTAPSQGTPQQPPPTDTTNSEILSRYVLSIESEMQKISQSTARINSLLNQVKTLKITSNNNMDTQVQISELAVRFVKLSKKEILVTTKHIVSEVGGEQCVLATLAASDGSGQPSLNGTTQFSYSVAFFSDCSMNMASALSPSECKDIGMAEMFGALNLLMQAHRMNIKILEMVIDNIQTVQLVRKIIRTMTSDSQNLTCLLTPSMPQNTIIRKIAKLIPNFLFVRVTWCPSHSNETGIRNKLNELADTLAQNVLRYTLHKHIDNPETDEEFESACEDPFQDESVPAEASSDDLDEISINNA